MFIKVISSLCNQCWYSNMIGKIFEVDSYNTCYVVRSGIHEGKIIPSSDARTLKIDEVKREVNEGDYIKIKNPVQSYGYYKKGDVLKVTDFHNDPPFVGCDEIKSYENPEGLVYFTEFTVVEEGEEEAEFVTEVIDGIEYIEVDKYSEIGDYVKCVADPSPEYYSLAEKIGKVYQVMSRDGVGIGVNDTFPDGSQLYLYHNEYVVLEPEDKELVTEKAEKEVLEMLEQIKKEKLEAIEKIEIAEKLLAELKEYLKGGIR